MYTACVKHYLKFCIFILGYLLFFNYNRLHLIGLLNYELQNGMTVLNV